MQLAWHRIELVSGVRLQVRERGRQEAGARQSSAAVLARAPSSPHPVPPDQHMPHSRGETVPSMHTVFQILLNSIIYAIIINFAGFYLVLWPVVSCH